MPSQRSQVAAELPRGRGAAEFGEEGSGGLGRGDEEFAMVVGGVGHGEIVARGEKKVDTAGGVGVQADLLVALRQA